MSKYCESENLYDGKSELFRIYYDKSGTNFDEMLRIELITLIYYFENRWLIFKAIKSELMNEILIISKN